jgi:hypothetical protein
MAGHHITLTPFSDESHDGFDPPTDENNPYSNNVHTKSSRQSSHSAISSIPPSLPDNDDIPFIHRKHRAAFRSSSSVRALQLSSTPSPSPLAPPQYRAHPDHRKWPMGAVKRFSSSVESEAEDDDGSAATADDEVLRRVIEAHRQDAETRRGGFRVPSDLTATSPGGQAYVQPPLILLHVSILPCPMPSYSHKVLEAHAPQYLVDNYRLLQERLTEMVMARGLLIPHPGDEYDVLEERLLETLDLVPPRVLGCGHFFGDGVENESDDDNSVKTMMDSNENENENENGEGATDNETTGQRAICNYAHDDDTEPSKHAPDPDQGSDEDVCDTCNRAMRLPHRGAGHGTHRWEVNFYAANGLMRAGAWSAAWREMERVDVEITPWMPSPVRRALDQADRDEDRAAAADRRRHELHVEMLQLDVGAAAQRIRHLEQHIASTQADLEGLASQNRQQQQQQQSREPSRQEHQQRQQDEEQKQQQEREVPQAAATAHIPAVETKRPGSNASSTGSAAVPVVVVGGHDIPLGRLLWNYLRVLARDRRNLALAALSGLVLVLGVLLMGSTTAATAGATDKTTASSSLTLNITAAGAPLLVDGAQTVALTTSSVVAIVTAAAAQNASLSLVVAPAASSSDLMSRASYAGGQRCNGSGSNTVIHPRLRALASFHELENKQREAQGVTSMFTRYECFAKDERYHTHNV